MRHYTMYLKTPTYCDTVNRMGICLCIMLVLFNFSSGFWYGLCDLIALFLPIRLQYLTDVLAETLYYLSCFILPAVLFIPLSRGREREPIRWSIRMPAYFPFLILAALAVTTAAAYINGWFLQLIRYPDPGNSYGGATDASAIALFITVSLAPAFCEELLFRGVIYGNLRRFGRPMAVLVSAILFALMHENIAQIFYTFVAGILLALCYELTDSIWCGIFLHLFNNLYSCVQEILVSRIRDRAYAILYLCDGALLLAGAAAGMLLLLLYRKGRLIPAPEKAPAEPESLFGNFPDETRRPAVKPDRRTARREFFAPGMTVFVVLTLLSVALRLLLAYTYPYWGFDL